MVIRFGLTLVFVVCPVLATVAATDGDSTLMQYGIPGALAVAMSFVGLVIRQSLAANLRAMERQTVINERLAGAVLTLAQELLKRPCVAPSEKVQDLATSLLEGEEVKK